MAYAGHSPAFGQTLRYDIAGQDLSKALVSLALDSHRNIVFSPQITAHRISTPVIGDLTFAEALGRMLAGTGLTARIQPDGSVVILRAPLAPTPARVPPPPHLRPTSPEPTLPDAVVVTAKKRADALAALRAQASQVVLSGAALEGEPDHDLAEALGRLPGVLVLDSGASATNSVPVDFAGRGEGDYAALRGFDAEFNISQINGVDTAQSQPYSRGVQLSLLPTAGLAQVVVVKTPTADKDGDAIGGLINIQTPDAFDFTRRDHVAFSLGGQYQDEAARYGRDPFGGAASAELAHRFGPDQSVGVYLAAYYSAERFSNEVVDGFYPALSNQMFAYRVETASGASAPGLDPAANLVLTGLDEGLTTGEVRRYGGDLALDWRPRPGLSAYLRLTLAQADTDQQSYYAQIYGEDISASPLGQSGLFGPQIGAVRPRYYFETNPETAVLDTLLVGGTASLGRVGLDSNLSASWGETNDPHHFELSGRQPEVGPALPFGGAALFATTDGPPIPLLSAAQLSEIEDFAGYGARRAGELTQEFSNQVKFAYRLDATYDVNAHDRISVGIKVADALRNHTYRDYTSAALYTTDANDPTLASLGFVSGQLGALAPGVFDAPAPTFDAAKAMALFDTNVKQAFGSLAGAIDTCATLYVNNFNCDTQRGLEVVSAAYIDGRFDVGGLQVSPGFRFEHTQIDSRFWVIPHAADGSELAGHFATTQTSYDEPLPSLRLSYPITVRSLLQAAAWASYVRPAMFQLGGSSQVLNAGAAGAFGDATTVIEGNPDLKPVKAVNLDLDWTYDGPHGARASAELFYKGLEDFIFDSVAGDFTNLTASNSGGTVIEQPRNGGAGRVWGLELSGRWPFANWPGSLDGFGVAGNLTLERSSVDTGQAGLSRHERLIDQPNQETNLQLFYERPWVAFRLSYRMVGPYVAQYGTLGATSALDTWVRATARLDAQASLDPGRGWRLSLSGSNLLNDRGYAATIGDRSWTIPSLAYTGRTLFLTVRWAR